MYRMKRVKLFYIISIVVLCGFSGDTYFTEWNLRKEKDGIKIYTRVASNTNIKEVKTVLTINTSVDKLTNAIFDVENYSKWMENILNPKVLKKVSQNESYLYYEMDAPWPTQNRDIVNRTSISLDQSNGTTLISSTAVPNHIAEKENIVRITLSEGSWILKELPDGKVEVTHLLLVSPGGNIPGWVINMFIVNHPYETHLNLRKMLE